MFQMRTSFTYFDIMNINLDRKSERIKLYTKLISGKIFRHENILMFFLVLFKGDNSSCSKFKTNVGINTIFRCIYLKKQSRIRFISNINIKTV